MDIRSILLLTFFLLCILIVGLPVSAASDSIIKINPIGDKHVGDKFTISAQTNLPIGSEIIVQIYSSLKAGATGTVKVITDNSGNNKITFYVDASAFKPDSYTVYMYAPLSGAFGTSQFNILSTNVPTVVTTNIVTSSSPKPVININPIGDKHVGDKFTITGITTFPVDKALYVMITLENGDSGASGTTKPVSGTYLNSWSFDVDATTFKPGEYKVNVFDLIMHSATDSKTFNILAQLQTPTATHTLSNNMVINIDPVNDKHVGDKFTITAQTNLPEGNDIVVKIYSSTTTGATGTVKIIKGTNGMNKITFDVDASAFNPGVYNVIMGNSSQSVSGNIKFNILNMTESTPNLTISSTKSVNQLLEEQNKKIDEQNKLIEEQNKKLAEQSGILDQILNYIKRIFGMQS